MLRWMTLAGSTTVQRRSHDGELPMRVLSALVLAAVLLSPAPSRAAEVYGIGLEGFPYPHPVSMLALSEDDESLRMAYMDVRPTGTANGRTVLLLHGRNFPASYWDTVIEALAGAGYRVVVPDQIGFGKSTKPTFALSFDMLASHTVKLLDHLQIQRADIVAHSMGGMLAVRLARAYPTRIEKIVLEAPIGLEDYRNFAPPVETAQIMAQEDRLTAEGYRTQLMTNYSLTLPPEAITPFIEARMRIKGAAEYPRWLLAFVNSYQMIYSQPVVYEIPLVQQPVLFIMGGNDRNAPGRGFAPMELRARMGDNTRLARELAARMPNGKVEVYDGIGHLVHMEAVSRFNASTLAFLNAGR
jgi:pimeloyl-ACP methyl ester carboxylesterase